MTKEYISYNSDTDVFRALQIKEFDGYHNMFTSVDENGITKVKIEPKTQVELFQDWGYCK